MKKSDSNQFLEPLLSENGITCDSEQQAKRLHSNVGRRTLAKKVILLATICVCASIFYLLGRYSRPPHTSPKGRSSDAKWLSLGWSKSSMLGYSPSEEENAKWVAKTEHGVQMPYDMPDNLPVLPVNESLGFGAIYAINLPYRADRRTELSLIGASLDMKIQTLPGVVVKDLNRKGLPWVKDDLTDNALGCYLSHMYFYEHVVQTGLKSALALEDDADWDVNIK